MIWALVENKRVEAIPKTKGICPLCGVQVISKCGTVNVWHWSHSTGENCDAWYEPESFWHKHWKLTFGMNNSEIGITKNNKKHFADILTNENVVIELQNSPIPKPIIREREDFYGERMLWLINGDKFKENLSSKDFWEDQDYLEQMSLPHPPVRWIRSSPEIEKGPNGEFFKWNHPRKSWADVRRPVFIDISEDLLFRVIEGMGTSQIRGTYISKENFINKYGGSYEYYCEDQAKTLPTPALLKTTN